MIKNNTKNFSTIPTLNYFLNKYILIIWLSHKWRIFILILKVKIIFHGPQNTRKPQFLSLPMLLNSDQN